jgi:acetoin utilization deacetylase AcuC-like enzyme
VPTPHPQLLTRLLTHSWCSQIFQADDRVTTFSMHCSAQAFPLRLEVSDYDLPCPDGVEDGDYLRTLAMYMPGLLRRHKPDLVFYQGGVDGLAEDSLGRMNLTRAGLSKRNSIVYEACLSMNVPIVLTLGGGYARPDISPSVDAVRVWHRATSPSCTPASSSVARCLTTLPLSCAHRQHADVYTDAMRALRASVPSPDLLKS